MGYHQVEVDSRDRDRAKTAFLTHRGLYIYNMIPFGLCNAPATFQRLMERVLGPLIGVGVLVYLDDVLIYANTPEQLIDILGTVLKLLAEAGLKCKATKCSLLTKSVNYLGRLMSKDGIYPDPAKPRRSGNGLSPAKGKASCRFSVSATTTGTLSHRLRTSVMPCTKHRGRNSSNELRPSISSSMTSNSSCCYRKLFVSLTRNATSFMKPMAVGLHSVACSSRYLKIQAWSTQSVSSAAPSPDPNATTRPTSWNSMRWYGQSRTSAYSCLDASLCCILITQRCATW